MDEARRFLNRVLGLLCVVAVALTSMGAATAADYPVKTLQLMAPFPPGGTLDILARGLAPNLAPKLGQQVVVENRPGANGVIGADLVARAPADGCTMLIWGGSGIAVHPALLPKLPYDP